MSEQFNQNPSVVSSSANTDVVALIKKMQQQLDFLEKKIDTLISQSHEKPLREKHFSKPFRPFGHSHRHGKAEYDNNFSGRPGERHQGDQHQGFGQKKKTFFNKRQR